MLETVFILFLFYATTLYSATGFEMNKEINFLQEFETWHEETLAMINNENQIKALNDTLNLYFFGHGIKKFYRDFFTTLASAANNPNREEPTSPTAEKICFSSDVVNIESLTGIRNTITEIIICLRGGLGRARYSFTTSQNLYTSFKENVERNQCFLSLEINSELQNVLEQLAGFFNPDVALDNTLICRYLFDAVNRIDKILMGIILENWFTRFSSYKQTQACRCTMFTIYQSFLNSEHVRYVITEVFSKKDLAFKEYIKSVLEDLEEQNEYEGENSFKTFPRDIQLFIQPNFNLCLITTIIHWWRKCLQHDASLAPFLSGGNDFCFHDHDQPLFSERTMPKNESTMLSSYSSESIKSSCSEDFVSIVGSATHKKTSSIFTSCYHFCCTPRKNKKYRKKKERKIEVKEGFQKPPLKRSMAIGNIIEPTSEENPK